MKEAFWSPTGMYVVVRAAIGQPGWIVRVLNFATWKHRSTSFPDADAARSHAALWKI